MRRNYLAAVVTHLLTITMSVALGLNLTTGETNKVILATIGVLYVSWWHYGILVDLITARGKEGVERWQRRAVADISRAQHQARLEEILARIHQAEQTVDPEELQREMEALYARARVGGTDNGGD